MRCRFCNRRMQKEEYQFDADQGEFVETGKHKDAACLATITIEERFDPAVYDSLTDFHESGA